MRRLLLPLLLLLSSLGFVACEEQKEADSAALTRPLPADPSPTPDPKETNLTRYTVGLEAPDFSLTSHQRQAVKLSDWRGKKNVILVFYRGHF